MLTARVMPLFEQGAIGMKSDKGIMFSAPRSQITDKAGFRRGGDWEVQFDFENHYGCLQPFLQKLQLSQVRDHAQME